MKRKLNIWWKLAFVSAVANMAAIPIWIMLFSDGYFPESWPIPVIVPLSGLLALPMAYLMIFSLWHWRTRYAGNQHLAWPILFVMTAWPLSNLPGSVFTALAYCVLHLVPDARGKGGYASPAPVTLSPPATPLPRGYQVTKSACFVLGWAFTIGGVLTAIIMCIADFVIWNSFEETLPTQVGKTFTESMSKALWVGSQISKILGLTCLLCAIAVAAGATLIAVSQRLRWRLLEEQEKEELKRNI